MKLNMSGVDRIIRIIVAIAIGVLYLMDALSGVLGAILMILAVIFILTSAIGFCPLYRLFNISTKKTEKIA